MRGNNNVHVDRNWGEAEAPGPPRAAYDTIQYEMEKRKLVKLFTGAGEDEYGSDGQSCGGPPGKKATSIRVMVRVDELRQCLDCRHGEDYPSLSHPHLSSFKLFLSRSISKVQPGGHRDWEPHLKTIAEDDYFPEIAD